jgi:hypothetical protein
MSIDQQIDDCKKLAQSIEARLNGWPIEQTVIFSESGNPMEGRIVTSKFEELRTHAKYHYEQGYDIILVAYKVNRISRAAFTKAYMNEVFEDSYRAMGFWIFMSNTGRDVDFRRAKESGYNLNIAKFYDELCESSTNKLEMVNSVSDGISRKVIQHQETLSPSIPPYGIVVNVKRSGWRDDKDTVTMTLEPDEFKVVQLIGKLRDGQTPEVGEIPESVREWYLKDGLPYPSYERIMELCRRCLIEPGYEYFDRQKYIDRISESYRRLYKKEKSEQKRFHEKMNPIWQIHMIKSILECKFFQGFWEYDWTFQKKKKEYKIIQIGDKTKLANIPNPANVPQHICEMFQGIHARSA